MQRHGVEALGVRARWIGKQPVDEALIPVRVNYLETEEIDQLPVAQI